MKIVGEIKPIFNYYLGILNNMKHVLVLHGALGSASHLKPIIDLLKQSYQVFTLDFSGHGVRASDTVEFSIPLFADDILHFLQTNNINHPIPVFGYSMGAYVALYLQSIRPGTFSHIYSYATKFDWNATSALKESQMLQPEKIEQKVPQFAAMLMQRHSDSWKRVCTKTAAMMLALGACPALNADNMKSIQIPVLISVGTEDKMIQPEESHRFASYLPNAAFCLIPYAEHAFEKQDMEMLYERLVLFFESEQ